jgi:hypothetical protein
VAGRAVVSQKCAGTSRPAQRFSTRLLPKSRCHHGSQLRYLEKR